MYPFRLSPLLSWDECTLCSFRENGRLCSLAAVCGRRLHLCTLDGGRLVADASFTLCEPCVVDACHDPAGDWLLLLCADGLRVLGARDPALEHPRCRREIQLTVQGSAVAWWQNDASEPIAIVGDHTGGLTFVHLETQKVVRKSYIVGKIFKLTVYYDDDADSVVLLITSSKNRQWSLILEKRFKKENQLCDKKKTPKGKEPNKRMFDEFLTTIKTTLWPESSVQKRSQSTSNVPNKLGTQSNQNNPTPITFTSPEDDNTKIQTLTTGAEDPQCKNNVYKWIVSPQSSDGRHFVSICNINHCTFTLHRNLEDRNPVYTFKFETFPENFNKILWHQKLIYIFGSRSVQIHSSHFSCQEENEESQTLIWEDVLKEDETIIDAWNISQVSSRTSDKSLWVNTKEISELKMPRFNLGSSLIVTNKKAYLLTTSCDPTEWIVNQLINGNGEVEKFAASLKVPLQPLLVAAGDVLLCRNLVSEAFTLYQLGKLPSDEILYRLGALGLFFEILTMDYQPRGAHPSNIYILNHVMHTMSNSEHLPVLLNLLEKNNDYDAFSNLRLCADIGLWKAIETITSKTGDYWLCFQSLMSRRSGSPCRGFLSLLLNKLYTQFLITEDASPLLKFIEQNCESFDTTLLKALCLWTCPLQDCFRFLFKALSTGKHNKHLNGMKRLIKTFFGLISTLHTRLAFVKPDILLMCNLDRTSTEHTNTPVQETSPSKTSNSPIVVSCSHNRWAIAHNGGVKLSISGMHPSFVDMDMSLIGKAISVSCGREHILILTENGLYAFGNNRYGQLGIGCEVKTVYLVPVLIGATEKKKCDIGTFSWCQESIVQIAAGQYHSACVTDTGALYTWGWGIHGQLAHGSIFNKFHPKRVDHMRQETVVSVGCGSYHTALLTKNGCVYVCGNGTFGQMGNYTHQKSNLPLRVDVGSSPAVSIAVGYFHTLVLLENNDLFIWGSSPQKLRLRARSAKRKALSMPTESQDDSSIGGPSSPLVEDDLHLYPNKVDTSNVKGKIFKISAGWLHSCLVDDLGQLYVWGLNFDCQLGTGNRNEVLIPTVINFNNTDGSPSKYIDLKNSNGLPEIGCGGDFTVFVNSSGKVYTSGNTCLEEDAGNRGKLYFVKFKNTTRKIRLPPPLHANQFKHITDVDLTKKYRSHNDASFDWPVNPLATIEDFDNPLWAMNTLEYLHKYICDDTPLVNNYLLALLASIRGDYAVTLNLHLNSLVNNSESKPVKYLQHSSETPSDVAEKGDIVKILQNRIKACSVNFLTHANNTDYEFVKFDCQCAEGTFIPEEPVDRVDDGSCSSDEFAVRANRITESVLSSLPESDVDVWSDCVNEAILFWTNHGLNVNELEEIFRNLSMNGRKVEMASAVFCSRDKGDVQKHLSPAFNLDLCDSILETW